MSLFGNISMLNQAMRTYQDGLNVTANNVANATTIGYTRQRLTINSLAPVNDGALQYGQGVTSVSIDRLRDVYLVNQIKFQLSELGRSDARNEGLKQLAAIFPEIANPASTAGLQGAMDDVVTKFTALEATPTSIAAKTAVRDSLDTLAKRLNVDTRMIYDMQTNLDLEVGKSIDQANAYINQIASLNTQISLSTASAQGNPPGTLLDAREQAAEKLSQLINANFRITADGSMSVVFSGGTLVDHGRVNTFKAIPSTTAPGRTSVGFRDNQKNIFVDVTSDITSGRIGGLIQARDVDAQQARLDLDKMAYGFISRMNEINHSYVAADFTTSHDIFSGTKASDIEISSSIKNNVDYIGGTRDALNPGDLAKLQASLENFVMYSSIQTSQFSTLSSIPIDPTQTLASQLGNFPPANSAPNAVADSVINPGKLVIAVGSNSVTINWGVDQTLNQIIANINGASGGAFYATFDQTSQKMLIYGSGPMTVYDQTFNLGRSMLLSSVVTSSAPINNSPLSTLNPVDDTVPMTTVQNLLDVFTPVDKAQAAPFTAQVDQSQFTWQPSDSISFNILPNLTGATPANHTVDSFFDPVTQTVVLLKSGDPVFNATLTAGNPMQSIGIKDVTGNLTRFLNLDSDTNSSRIFSQMVTSVGANVGSEGVLKTQAQAVVDNTQQMQDQQSSVDLNEELAQSRLYQRSYEASVRLQGIMDEMLNVLINHMGSSEISTNSSV